MNNDLITQYIGELLDLKYLTTEPIRRCYLTKYHLSIVLYVYALSNLKQFRISHQGVSEMELPNAYFLTDEGLSWLYDRFNSMDMRLLCSRFTMLTNNYKAVRSGSNPMYKNFEGTSGPVYREPKDKYFLLIHKKGLKEERQVYTSLREAKLGVKMFASIYPADTLTLYSYYYRADRGWWDRNKLKVGGVK